MNESLIILKGLLSVIESSKTIMVNLYNEQDLLLISFGLEGWEALDDFLCDDTVTKIKINNLTSIDITIDTSNN